jgi:DNA-binding LacI/PurR family transcriptional regulator
MALRDDPRIAAATKRRVLLAAERYGYERNADLATVMAHVQTRRPRDYQGNLVVIPVICTTVSRRQIEGCVRRARRLGYKVEVLADYEQHTRLARVLRARGTAGVIFIGWPWRTTPEAVKVLRPVCEQFPCAVVAARPESPPMHAVMSDVFLAMRTAVAAVLRLGYRRPLAFINPYLDDLQDQAYTGAFLAAQRQLPLEDRIGPEEIPLDDDALRARLEATRPDCVITHDNPMHDRLRALGWRVPRDLGLVHLDLHAGLPGPEHSGIDQNHELMGEAAVDSVVAQVHRGERGVPATQKCILVEASWVGAATTRAARRKTTRSAG